jgi:hypothetical protein
MERIGTIGDLAKFYRMEWLTNKMAEAKKGIARRQLEGKLARIIATANGHRKNNLPKHALAYQSLWTQAEGAVDKFCYDHAVQQSDVYAQIPALEELKGWGAPAPKSVPLLARFGLTAVGIVIALIITGFVSGAAQRLFTLGWHLAHAGH